MNTIKNASLTLALLIAPLAVHAHPGHDGDQTHSLGIGLIFLAVSYFAIKQTRSVVRKLGERHLRQ